jgi:hypothetical protein
MRIDLKMRPVISTKIKRIEFNQLTGDLDVTFVSGNVYRYYGVPDSVYQQFIRAPSIGTFFVRSIRDHYPYRERRLAMTGS